jgi:asparagine synthase (glutamine-hydrolysing)
VVESKNSFLNPQIITDILTLRYSPTIEPILPTISWQDFQKKSSLPSIEFIENSIKNSIKKTIETNSLDKICIALSGGVDSTLILSLLKETFPTLRIEAISIKFANSVDESKNAAQIASNFNANHHIEYVENYLNELPKAISITKLPFWDLHWYYVVKKAETLSKCLASGDGGDELFGGYTFRYEKFLSLTNNNSSSLEKVKAYLECHERDRVPDQEKIFLQKANFSWNSIYKIILPFFDNPLEPLDQVFLADYNGKLLYNFSLVNTRLHSFFGICSLTPLLTKELISYSVSLPLENKYNKQVNLGKILLRQLLKKYGAERFVSEKKLGFNVNTINLWKDYGHELCEYYFDKSRVIEDNWINQEWIKKYINKNDLDVRYVNKFLGLLAFEIWYRLFVTMEMSSNTQLS